MVAQKRHIRRSTKGFTLIETLVVLVVLGIICEAGFSLYSGVTTDYTLKTANDKLSAFFSTCRQRAMLRNTPLTIVFFDRVLKVENSPSLFLNIYEVDERFFPEKIEVTPGGAFVVGEKKISQLIVPIRLGKAKTADVTVNL